MPHPLNYESPQKKQSCPFCHSTSTVSGDLLGGDIDAVQFVPHNLKLFTLSLNRPRVLIERTPMACSACGALWSGVDAQTLRAVLARWTKDGAP